MSIFCDWLDVTFDPDNAPLVELESWLISRRFALVDSSSASLGEKQRWESVTGSSALVVQRCSKFARVSASGSILGYLRSESLLAEFCFVLASCPYRVTRIDAYLDLPIDGADFLAQWRSNHPESSFALYRNKLPVTYFTTLRESDGRESGTIYFGHRTRARITARIYDKALQVYQVSKGAFCPPPTTRVEVTRREGASLRDVCEPAALFWDIAGTILQAPPSVPAWNPVDMSPEFPKPAPMLPYELLKRGVENDPHLAALLRVADTFPGGRDVLIRLLQTHVESASVSEAA